MAAFSGNTNCVKAIDEFRVDEIPESSKDVSPKELESGSPGTMKNELLKNSETGRANYDHDARQLIAIFPEEVWLLIAKMMDDPKDIESLSNASLFFRNLLLPQRALFLFPNVWGLLGRYFQTRKERTNFKRFSPPVKCADCRRKRRVRWFSNILKCRLVCKSWCDVIDKFYEELPNPCSGISVSNWRHSCNLTREWTLNHFGSRLYRERDLEGSMGSILRHFHRTHHSNQRNPFLGRLFSIHCGSAQDMNPITNVLQKYGQHIWYFVIEVYDNFNDFPSYVDWYAVVRGLLLLTPNLKHLTLCRSRHVSPAFVDSLDHLIEEINVNHLPELRNLVSIKAENLWSSVFNELIHRNKHIYRLEVRPRLISFAGGYNLYSAPLDDLKQLRIVGSLDDNFPAVRNQWPLNKFEAYVQYNTNWLQLFNRLENWAETLTDVTLILPVMLHVRNERDMDEWLSLRLQLPNVKMFTLKVESMFSWDLILPMRESLEILKISTLSDSIDIQERNQLYEWAGKKQIIQYLEWTDRLLESNIWTLFPKLKQLCIIDQHSQDEEEDMKGDLLTRDDWRKTMTGTGNQLQGATGY